MLAVVALLATAWPAYAQWQIQIPNEEGRIHEKAAEDDAEAPPADDVAPEADDDAEEGREDVYRRFANEVVAEPDDGKARHPTVEEVPSLPELSHPRTPAPAPASPPATTDAAPPIVKAAAGAKGAAPAPEPSKPAAVERPAPATRLELPGLTSADLWSRWAKRRDHLRELDPVQAKAEADAIVGVKEALAIRDLPEIGYALVREGRRDLARNDPTDALEKAELAAKLAPDLPSTWWFLARARLAKNWKGVGAVLSASWQATRRAFGVLPERRATLASLALVGIAGVLAAGLAFLLVALGRHLRLYLHDFHHLFPSGVVRLQTGVLAVGLLAAPFILRLGPAVALLAATAVVWLYVSRTEKMVLAVFLVLVSAAPLAVGRLAEHTAFWSTRAADVWTVETTGRWAPAVARMKARAAANEAGWQELFTLARWNEREGRLAEAKALWEKTLEKAPRSAEAQNDLGATLYALGDLDGAKAAFQRAIELDPRLAAAYHNLAKIDFRRGDLGPGQEARRRATELDPALVAGHPDDATALNRAVAMAPLPDAALEALAKRPEEAARAREQLELRLSGVVPLAAGPWLPAGGVALLAVLGLVLARTRPSLPCVKCGRSVCRRCDADVGSGQLCGQCVNVFQKQGVVPPQVRVAKELRIRSYQQWRERAARMLGLILPGAGQVALDRPLRGILFLVLFLVSLAGLLLRLGPVPAGLDLGGPALWRVVLFGVLALGTYAAALWDLFRRE